MNNTSACSLNSNKISPLRNLYHNLSMAFSVLMKVHNLQESGQPCALSKRKGR